VNWQRLLGTGANILLIGPRSALDAFLVTTGGEFSPPVRFVRPAERIPKDSRGTTVLLDTERLNSHQREELHAWLTDCKSPKPQIISLSESPLWRPDAPELFPLDLYYRLNTICVELSS
jgi:hypothetical protein